MRKNPKQTRLFDYCQQCQNPLSGRADKVFCCDHCRVRNSRSKKRLDNLERKIAELKAERQAPRQARLTPRSLDVPIDLAAQAAQVAREDALADGCGISFFGDAPAGERGAA